MIREEKEQKMDELARRDSRSGNHKRPLPLGLELEKTEKLEKP
jgi:hypothetical protein